MRDNLLDIKELQKRLRSLQEIYTESVEERGVLRDSFTLMSKDNAKLRETNGDLRQENDRLRDQLKMRVSDNS